MTVRSYVAEVGYSLGGTVGGMIFGLLAGLLLGGMHGAIAGEALSAAKNPAIGGLIQALAGGVAALCVVRVVLSGILSFARRPIGILIAMNMIGPIPQILGGLGGALGGALVCCLIMWLKDLAPGTPLPPPQSLSDVIRPLVAFAVPGVVI